MEPTTRDSRRRRVGLVLVALVILLFIGQMVALSLGSLEIAGVIFLVFVAGWFALRSYQRRSGAV
jgi:positive regulator of sigma E activity